MASGAHRMAGSSSRVLLLVEGSGGTGRRAKPNDGSVSWTGGSPKPSSGDHPGVDDPELLVAQVNGTRLDCQVRNWCADAIGGGAVAQASEETVSGPHPDTGPPGFWRFR